MFYLKYLMTSTAHYGKDSSKLTFGKYYQKLAAFFKDKGDITSTSRQKQPIFNSNKTCDKIVAHRRMVEG